VSSDHEVGANDVQVKFSMCTPREVNREMVKYYRLFLTLVLDRSERWASHPDHLTSRERRSKAYWI